MDKILLTAFLSALAGFITAILSIVKLVNEKESKTTDYRQSWTESVRNELSTLIGLIIAQASNIASFKKSANNLIKINTSEHKADEAIHKVSDHISRAINENQSSVSDTRKEIHQCYARARLHFKPDDPSFARVEQHYNVMMSLLNEMNKADIDNDAEIGVLREKVISASNEMTAVCRFILKTEWDRIKQGENAYQSTKKWSIAGSIVMLFILLSIGIHAGVSMWRANLIAAGSEKPRQTNTTSNEK